MQIIEFYDHHPISEGQVLDAVRRARRGLDGTLTADDLFPFDQDHYGGGRAPGELARGAGGKPPPPPPALFARPRGAAPFLASRRGCRGVGVELNPGRASGMARLTHRVGLHRLVTTVRADATALPFRTGRFDACVSQEALLHVVDKAAVLADAHRVLVAGG